MAPPLTLILLTSRIAVATVFLKSGLLKIQSWDVAVQLFRDEYRVPIIPPEIVASADAAVHLLAQKVLAPETFCIVARRL